MVNTQEVTIKEYFSEMRLSQVNAKPSERYTYAKQYMNNRCNLQKQGVSFVQWVKATAAERNMTPTELTGELALKELNLLIETDLLEFCAEMGLKTIEAMKRDAEIKEARELFFHRYGYNHQSDEPTAVMLLRQKTDLFIVRRNDRPCYVADLSNPFLIDPDDPFKPTDELPFKITDKKSPPDWDNMSEEEWQKMKEADAEERLQRRLNTIKEKQEEENARLQKALSLIDDYPGAMYN